MTARRGGVGTERTNTVGARARVEVLFEDNHLLALAKPPGLLTQQSGRTEDSLEERARRYVKESRGKPGAVFLHVVHRLDREVSGVVLCATTGKALARLNEQTRRHRARKLYHAVVAGRPQPSSGELVHWLVHARMHARVTEPGAPEARECRLGYRRIAQTAAGTVIEIELATGRYHQIRAQLAAAGWPILGDTRYGGPARTALGIALHHRRMELEHPVRREPLVIEAPYPEGWPS